jgi:hypothetical protein
MSNVPNPELWHPTWCDPEHCTSGQLASYHKSTPTTVGGHRLFDLKVTVQLWQDADEPDTTAVADVVVTFDTSQLTPNVSSFSLEAEPLRDLVDALMPLRMILDARGRAR